MLRVFCDFGRRLTFWGPACILLSANPDCSRVAPPYSSLDLAPSLVTGVWNTEKRYVIPIDVALCMYTVSADSVSMAFPICTLPRNPQKIWGMGERLAPFSVGGWTAFRCALLHLNHGLCPENPATCCKIPLLCEWVIDWAYCRWGRC